MSLTTDSDRFAPMPNPPYYAVIFSSAASDQQQGYAEMGNKMVELALQQPECIGLESTRDAQGFGITVSYWKSEKGIMDWKAQVQHTAAQRAGMSTWYEHYRLRVAKVERHYSGPEGRPTL